jgi:hypothetical protein
MWLSSSSPDVRRRRAALRLALAATSLHSVGLGFLVYGVTRRFLKAAGFDPREELFYPRQSGAFLVALGLGYGGGALNPDRHAGLVALTITSKAIAVVFLLREARRRGGPLSVLAAGIADAILGLVIAALALAYYPHRRSATPEGDASNSGTGLSGRR